MTKAGRLGDAELALKGDPDNPTRLRHYGDVLVKSGKTGTALPYFKRALEIVPDDAHTLSNYGNALVKALRPEEALQPYKRALEIEPKNATTLRRYGNALVAAGRPKEAPEHFERALAIDPKNAITLSSYGKALVEAGRPKEAPEHFERALAIDPDNAITLSNYGNALVKALRPEEALQPYKRALEIEPKNATTLRRYRDALAKAGRVEEALKHFRGEYVVITLTRYGNDLVKAGRVEEALEHFERALEIDSDNVITLNSYGNALLKCRRVDEALEHFERALKIDSNDAITLSNYGKALVKDGRREEALKHFEHALKIGPKDVITLNQYAQALVSTGKAMDALDYFDRALKINPDDAITLGSYASALVTVGRPKDALKHFRHALEIDSNNFWFLVGYGDALKQVGKEDESLKYFGQALAVAPDNTRLLYSIATVLQMQQQPADALDKLQRILELSGPQADNFIIHVSIGRLYFRLGRDTEGIEQYEKALRGAYNKDAARLRIARDLMSIRPRHEYANELLRGIDERYPRYPDAKTALALNLRACDYFQEFGGNAGGRIDGQTELYDALYHRVSNLVAILKESFHQRSRAHEEAKRFSIELSETLKDLKEHRVALNINREHSFRDLNYEDIVNSVAEAAHDIVDLVGNKISVLKEDLWNVRRKLPEGGQGVELYDALISDVDDTFRSLNELKRTNEGIRVRSETLSLGELLLHWSQPPAGKARIKVRIGESDAKRRVTLDAQKVRGFMSELVGNSLKHNTDEFRKEGLQIKLTVSIEEGLPVGRDGEVIVIPGVEYLVIVVEDNGKGIARENKELVFQPLYTTSSEGEGTGLGLFEIRRTLEQMGGSIHETGVAGEGSCFELYLPLTAGIAN